MSELRPSRSDTGSAVMDTDASVLDVRQTWAVPPGLLYGNVCQPGEKVIMTKGIPPGDCTGRLYEDGWKCLGGRNNKNNEFILYYWRKSA